MLFLSGQSAAQQSAVCGCHAAPSQGWCGAAGGRQAAARTYTAHNCLWLLPCVPRDAAGGHFEAHHLRFSSNSEMGA